MKITVSNNNEEYFLKVNVQYSEKLQDIHNGLLFLPERIKLEKHVPNLHDKEEFVIQISNVKEALKQGLEFKKVHRVINFSQEAWIESYIDMNTELRKNSKSNFKKEFSSDE